MSIVIVGHVDHGKSTIIGRLLADTNSLPEGKLAQVKEKCRRNARPFEYAFLLDALKEEQAQGITIDAARCFFQTARRKYQIIDAPGHIEFLRNMVTGAAKADAALLVIDAAEGVKENSKRHGYMLSLLGIKQVAVLINKMDLVEYSQKVFDRIVREYRDYLAKIGLEPVAFLPVSGMAGDNIAGASTSTGWFRGKTVLATLDDLQAAKLPEDKPFRLPVQAVYKFTRDGDNRRIIAGTIVAGTVRPGAEIVFFPSGKKSVVAALEAFNEPERRSARVGQAVGLTLTEQIYVRRGELAVLAGETKPQTATRLKTRLFWLGREPLVSGKQYLLKTGNAKVGAQLEQVNKVMDASTLAVIQRERVERHEIAECVLKLDQAVALDKAADLVETGRFVLIDDYEIAGGGLIEDTLPDEQQDLREKVMLRNYKWEKSEIAAESRAEKYSQRSALILITGRKDSGKKAVARELEKRLFDEGKLVYFLGIGNVLYGVDADIKGKHPNERFEHLRRLAEVSHLMLDAGVILIVTALDLTPSDLEIIKTVISTDRSSIVWVGAGLPDDLAIDLHLPPDEPVEQAASQIKELLQEQGAIFRP
ncbi:MAG: GTP-binding protein [Candidatus Margulisiibacteriota bacterium]